MQRLPELPEVLSLSAFTVAEARTLGVAAARLRRRDLVTPFRGVRTAVEHEAATDKYSAARAFLLRRIEAYRPLLRAGHLFSHGSAGELWKMWLPPRLSEHGIVDILAVHPARPPRMTGVRGHRTGRPVSPQMISGLPVTAPADTWRALAPVLSLDELIVAGDSLVRRVRPSATIARLVAAVHIHDGTAGARNARAAIGAVRAGCDSPRETRLRLLLCRSGLPEPAVNPIVSGGGAATIRYGDLVYEEWRVIVEYDGEQHRQNGLQYVQDVERLEQLAADGWIVIRVLSVHLANPAGVVARVEGALRSRGWKPPPVRSHL